MATKRIPKIVVGMVCPLCDNNLELLADSSEMVSHLLQTHGTHDKELALQIARQARTGYPFLSLTAAHGVSVLIYS